MPSIHPLKVYELARAIQGSKPRQIEPGLSVKADTVDGAASAARALLKSKGYTVRSISHLVGGGLSITVDPK